MIKKNSLVSVILNCYNGEQYLRDALNSVISQTYKNWELIFWDNKSTDNSKKIFETYKKENFKYFCSNEHTSLYAARNLAKQKCQGEFIAFIDADDTWEESKLEKQINLFNNKLVGVVYGNLWIYNQKLKKKKILSKEKLLKGKIFNKIFSNYNIGIITAMIRKKVLIDNNINFMNNLNHIGDFDLFIKLSKVCEFDSIQEPVATYRIHGNNLSLRNIDKEIHEMKNWLKKNQKDLNKDQLTQFLNRIVNREFIKIKLNKSFLETLNFFLKEKKLWKNFKNYLLLIMPVLIWRVN